MWICISIWIICYYAYQAFIKYLLYKEGKLYRNLQDNDKDY